LESVDREHQPGPPVVQQFLDAQANRFETLISGDSSRVAVKLLANLVQREALVLTYNHLLLLIGALFVFGLMLLRWSTARARSCRVDLWVGAGPHSAHDASLQGGRRRCRQLTACGETQPSAAAPLGQCRAHRRQPLQRSQTSADR